MPGAARFSTWVLILLWVLGCAAFIMKFVDMNGRSVLMGLTVMAIGVGALWFLGVWLAKDNPFHQEKLVAMIVRTLHNRTNLET